MKPLILISNDDGYQAKGLLVLTGIARQLGNVVVMSTELNASAKSMSLTTTMPLRARLVRKEESTEELGSVEVYASNGTPTDNIKLAVEHFCSSRPDLVVSGINHGSNASINVLYSGTLGAALEAAVSGYPAIGFSILDPIPEPDFSYCEPYVELIMRLALEKGLEKGLCLNVNFPYTQLGPIKGMKVCRASKAEWTDSYQKRLDPMSKPYYWLTGKFECTDNDEGTDQWALANGYASIVPLRPDYTAFDAIDAINNMIL